MPFGELLQAPCIKSREVLILSWTMPDQKYSIILKKCNLLLLQWVSTASRDPGFPGEKWKLSLRPEEFHQERGIIANLFSRRWKYCFLAALWYIFQSAWLVCTFKYCWIPSYAKIRNTPANKNGEREEARGLQEKKATGHNSVPGLNWQICQTNTKIMGKESSLIILCSTKFAFKPLLTLLLQSQEHGSNRLGKEWFNTSK